MYYVNVREYDAVGNVKSSVKAAYSDLAEKGASCCNAERLLERGYGSDELSVLPDTVVRVADGCGNPTAIGNLREGEAVLDLGCGAGIDVFLAARKVGERGRVIGVDMTDKMLEKARENAKKLDVKNVEFRKGELENLPVESGSVDVIFSNCVINLTPEKGAVFTEAFRVLKPEGRMIISDIVSQKEIPKFLRDNPGFWNVCGGGALLEDEYLNKIRQAGFVDVKVASRYNYRSEEVLGWTEGRYKPTDEERVAIEGLDQQLSSVTITAHKP
jgi:ubiquinone/menaquinone biosynthesis C-methylase UbiE